MTATGEAAPEVSLVVAMFNEAQNIEAFLDRARAALAGVESWEIICVDDGSSDNGLGRLLQQRQRDPRIRIVELSRNFGKDIALTAGLDHAAGRAVIPIDADLQDPPELIPELVATWRQGYDVVYAKRRSRAADGWLKRTSARLFYGIFGALARTDMPRDTGDFRLLDRRVVDALAQLPERNRFMKGLFAWVGFRQTGILYDRQPRHGGTSKWNYWRLWNYALDGMAAFSTLPLRIWTYLGLAVALWALGYGLVVVGRTIVHGVDVPGYASVMVGILFFGGVQLITLGVLGEYIGRIYKEVKQRPLYLVRGRHGFDDDPIGE